MHSCDCTNSKTGETKRKYETQSQADVACTESRKKYEDGDTLNTYYCHEGECWHVGNSGWDGWDDSRQEMRQEIKEQIDNLQAKIRVSDQMPIVRNTTRGLLSSVGTWLWTKIELAAEPDDQQSGKTRKG